MDRKRKLRNRRLSLKEEYRQLGLHLDGNPRHEPARPARPQQLLSSARTEEAAFHRRHHGNPILGESEIGHPSIREGCAIGGQESG